MPESKQYVTQVRCDATYKNIQRALKLLTSVQAIMVVLVGWSLWSGIVASGKSYNVLLKMEQEETRGEERKSLNDERNTDIKQDIFDLKAVLRTGFSEVQIEQRRLSDKLDKAKLRTE